MRQTIKWAVVVISIGLLLVVSLPVGLYAWDAYHIAQAKRAVAAGARALAHGDPVPWLRLRLSVSRADLGHAFAAGYEVIGHDTIGLALNAYEVKVRVANGDQYNFEAVKVDGEWTLHCCGHSTAEELEGPREEKPVLSLDSATTRRAARVFR